jgi:hypothetical protein
MPKIDPRSFYNLQAGRPDGITRTMNGLEKTEGMAPTTKYLLDPRVSRKFQYQFNVNFQDWVAIPKGRIVAFATNADFNTTGAGGSVAANANPNVAGSGFYFREFESQKLYHGLTIANGGVDVAQEPDQRGIDNGNAAADYTRTANFPVGVLTKNAYYKIDDTMFGGSVPIYITRGHIEVPYIPDRALAQVVEWGCATGGDRGAGDPGYLRPGDLVKSDANGHFVKWNRGTLTNIFLIDSNPVFTPAVAAVGELDVADAGVGMQVGDTVKIGTVTFTAVALGDPLEPDTPTAGEFNLGAATAADTAASLLARINEHEVTSGLVLAAEGTAPDKITLTAKLRGRVGNDIDLVGNDRCTVSAFEGGVDAGFSTNANEAFTAAIWAGADDYTQVVGKVIDVTGQLEPEGWLRWASWNFNMIDKRFYKFLGLNANDIDPLRGYPPLDKYREIWKYIPANGTGIKGLTDGSLIPVQRTDIPLGIIRVGNIAGDRLFFHLRNNHEEIDPATVQLQRTNVQPPDPQVVGVGQDFNIVGTGDIFTFERFDQDANMIVVRCLMDITEAAAQAGSKTDDIELVVSYTATGASPGVPTLWDLRGSVGAVNIVLGGLGY